MAVKAVATARRADDRVATVAAGDYIFREGDLGTEMYILRSGQVEILRNIGGEPRQLALLDRGDFFGEMSLLEELPRTASARAVTEVAVLVIDGSTFDRMLHGNPEIAVRMMRKLSRRLRQTDQLLQSLATTAETEVAAGGVPEPDVGPRELGRERLVHEASGMEFRLSASSETTLGRKDPVTGIYPDVDLTPLDQQRSVSRRHAKIHRRSESFFVAEDIGTMNGTFVNGTRIGTGVPVEIEDGDVLRVGLVDLRLRLGG